MALSRKSRSHRSRRATRKLRKTSRRSKRQRGGAVITLNCSLDAANKVQIASPPADVTVSSNAANTLTINSRGAINDIIFAGPGGAVNPRFLGIGTGIIVEQGVTALVPKSFTGVRALTGTQRKLDPTYPAYGEIKIRNLNTANLGLSAANTKFTITIKTPPDV